MLGKGVAILLISFPLPTCARGRRRARQSGFNIGCLHEIQKRPFQLSFETSHRVEGG